eukprot:g13198.t1
MSSSKKSISSVKDAEEENDHHSRGAEAELNSGAVEKENDVDQNEYPAARGEETEADIKADAGADPGAIEFEAARRWGPRTRRPQKPKAQGAATIPQPQPPHFRCLIEAVGTKVVPFLRPVEVRSLVCAIPLPSFVTEPFYNDLIRRADPSTLKKLEKKLKLTLEKPPPKSLSSTTQCRQENKLEQRHFHRCNYFQLWRYMCESCGILSKHGRRANGTGTLRLCEECLERWTDRAQFEKQLRHLQLPLCWTQRAAEGFAWIEGGDAGGATGDLFRTGILEGQMDAELLAALWQSLQDGLDSSRIIGAERSFGGGARGSGRGGGQSKLDSEDELEDGGNEDGYWSEDRDEDDSRAGGGDEEDHDGAARRRRLLDGQALVVVPSVLGIRAEIVAAEELCQRSATRKNGSATTRHDIIKASTDENCDDPMISSSMSTPESFDAGGQSVVDMIDYGHQPQHDRLHRFQNLRSGDTTTEQESCFATGSALSKQFSTLAEVEARLTRLQEQDCLLELPLDFAGLLIPTPTWREYEQALQKNKKVHFELFKDWRNVLPAMATAFENLARSSEEASSGGDEHEHQLPSTTGSSFAPSCPPHRRSSSPRHQEVQHLRAAASFLRDCLSPDTSAFSAWDEFWQQLLVEKYDRNFLKTCNRGKAHFIRQSVAEQVHARFSSKIFYKRHDEGVTLLQNAADLFREWIALLLFIADVEDVISFCPDRCEQIVRASQKMLKQLDRRHLQAIPVAGFAYKSRKQKAKESWDGNLERLRSLASAPGFKWDLALRGVAEADAGSSRNDYSASNYRDYTKEHIASTLAQLFRGGGLLCSPSATTVEELTDGATAHHSECWHDSDDAAEDVNAQEEMITSRKLNKSAGSGSGSQRQRNAPAPLGIYDADLMNPYDDHILERTRIRRRATRSCGAGVLEVRLLPIIVVK